MWSENKVSRVLGEVKLHETLIYFLQRVVNFGVLSLFAAGSVSTVPVTSTVFKTYSDMA